MNHTQPMLVAPRPVRFVPGRPATFRPPSRAGMRMMSAPTDGFARISEHGDENAENEEVSGSRAGSVLPLHSDRLSPRMSPRMSPSRMNYSSDALEEFLSILRPSFYQHSSSPLPNRRGTAPDFPSYKLAIHAKSLSTSSASDDDLGAVAAGTNTTTSPATDGEGAQGVERPLRRLSLRNLNESPGQEVVWSADWDYKPLVPPSPVSRSHTRNPFHRHPSYDAAFAALHLFTTSVSPSMTSISSPGPLSPARIPLPMPDADEEQALTTI